MLGVDCAQARQDICCGAAITNRPPTSWGPESHLGHSANVLSTVALNTRSTSYQHTGKHIEKMMHCLDQVGVLGDSVRCKKQASIPYSVPENLFCKVQNQASFTAACHQL